MNTLEITWIVLTRWLSIRPQRVPTHKQDACQINGCFPVHLRHGHPAPQTIEILCVNLYGIRVLPVFVCEVCSLFMILLKCL